MYRKKVDLSKFYTGPKVVLYSYRAGKTMAYTDECPAMCRDTGKCYFVTAFEGKPTKNPQPCEVSQCPRK